MNLFRFPPVIPAICMSLIFCACTSEDHDESVISKQKVVIGLDNYYNHETDSATGRLFHYTWSDTAMTGFSELGNLAVRLGADTVTIKDAPSAEMLAGLSVYLIVDPDTPQETEQPNYIAEPSITAIENWVKQGGALVLMANNTGNCEFAHLNMLAERFGIVFNEDTRGDSTPDTMELSTLSGFPEHPLFEGINRLFIKGICTLSVKHPAGAIYTESGDVIMAEAKVGTGMVYVLGDPWLYNEYIDIAGWDNQAAAENLLLWLMDSVEPMLVE